MLKCGFVPRPSVVLVIVHVGVCHFTTRVDVAWGVRRVARFKPPRFKPPGLNWLKPGLNRLVLTAKKWSKLVKTGQNQSKLIFMAYVLKNKGKRLKFSHFIDSNPIPTKTH